MRIPGLKTAKHAAKWLQNRIIPGAVILGYHRIANEEHDSFNNCVSPECFTQQMEILSQYANPVSLETLIAGLDFGSPLPSTVCVTFDDGYLDTLIHAKPILEKYKTPATVFITAGNLGEEFWWDELERYILDAPNSAGSLQLSENGRTFEWEFANLNITERTKQVVSIANFLRGMGGNSRRQLLDKIKEWAGNIPGCESSQARSMTPAELLSLVDGNFIQIGSHSVTHPMLSELSEADRRYEMEESKRLLEDIINKPILGFSYPNGHYSETDPDLVYKSGYYYACMSKNGTIRSSSQRFTLPRFWIGNIEGKSFYRWLKRWS